MFEALGDLRRNEIYICTGSSPRYAFLGRPDIDPRHKMRRRRRGGTRLHCDSNEIERLGFPVASMDSYAQDQEPRGKVVDWGMPIEIEGVRIDTGDVVFGDRDGVLIVPADVVEQAFAG